MTLNTSYKLYEFREISDVEPKHGLYAWYLNMQLSAASTGSQDNMVEALRRISKASRYPDLEIQMRGHLSLDLRGNLQHVWYGYDEKYYKELLSLLKYPEERALFQYIFNSAAPLLTSPLYIGISGNLKERLKTHKKLIQELGSSSTNIGRELAVEGSPEVINQDKTFAQRVVDRDINPNHLVVGVIYVEDISVPHKRISKTIRAAETLLNRMFHPILGRR